MALQTKTLTANGSKGHHKFTLKVNEETTSGNSSFMSYSFTIAPIQSGWDWYGHNIPYSVKIGSKTYTGSISSYNGSSTTTISSGSNIEIAHNTDGTKTIDISFSVTDNTGQSYTCGNASSSSTFKLTDLHKPPLFNSITFVENSSVLQNIGLSANDFVPYLSNKTATIQATTYDGATITQYRIINGTTKFTSTTNTINLNFTTEGIEMAYYYETSVSKEIPQLIIELTDNKGGVSSYNYTNTRYVMYAKPNLVQTSSSVKRNGQLSGKVIMSLVGTFYGSSVGTKSNSVTLSYKYWKTNVSEPSTYFPITGATTSGNVVNVNNWNVAKSGTPISDVDSNSAYYFKIKMVDGFAKESYITLNVPIGEYIRALLKDRVDFKKITIGGYNPFEYSTNEIIVGNWVDDKPIYRKVIDIGNLPNASQTIVSHNISNIKRIVKLYGSATRDSDKDTMPIPYVTFNSNNNGGINLYANNVSILVSTSTDRSSYTGYVVLEYTKTND